MAQKDPAFLFYPADWLAGTMGLTFEEQGAYLHLLIYQFNHGNFTKNEAEHMLRTCSQDAFLNVLKKFESDGVFYWKQRLADEIIKRQLYTESRRRNASGSKSSSLKKKKNEKQPDAYAQHMPEHMGNGNRNRNINEINAQNLVKVTTPPDQILENVETSLQNAFDEIYTEQQAIIWRDVDFQFELKTFCNKVRGSPEKYYQHDTGGIRLAFQAQLRQAKPIKKNKVEPNPGKF